MEPKQPYKNTDTAKEIVVKNQKNILDLLLAFDEIIERIDLSTILGYDPINPQILGHLKNVNKLQLLPFPKVEVDPAITFDGGIKSDTGKRRAWIKSYQGEKLFEVEAPDDFGGESGGKIILRSYNNKESYIYNSKDNGLTFVEHDTTNQKPDRIITLSKLQDTSDMVITFEDGTKATYKVFNV